jgi:hypothetical protein
VSTPLRTETIARIRDQLAGTRLSARQLAFALGVEYRGIASCLRGMHQRGEAHKSKARPGVEAVYWLRNEVGVASKAFAEHMHPCNYGTVRQIRCPTGL